MKWQKEVRICWARKLNSFQPRIFSAQWGREVKLRSILNWEVFTRPQCIWSRKGTKQNDVEKTKTKAYTLSSIQPPAHNLHASILFLIGSYPIITALLGHLGLDQGNLWNPIALPGQLITLSDQIVLRTRTPAMTSINSIGRGNQEVGERGWEREVRISDTPSNFQASVSKSLRNRIQFPRI